MIVPALLTDDRKKLIEMINVCSEFTDYVQIDIMDGILVPSKSIGLAELEGYKAPIRSEAHLMVKDPYPWIKAFKQIGSERIICHLESGAKHQEVISTIKELGLEVGLAINPSTSIENLKPFIERIDSVLFLSVNPGFYGAEFIPAVLDKISIFKSQHPNKIAGIDGGVKLENFKQIKASGADYICVGSGILRDDSPKRAYQSFIKLSNA